VALEQAPSAAWPDPVRVAVPVVERLLLELQAPKAASLSPEQESAEVWVPHTEQAQAPLPELVLPWPGRMRARVSGLVSPWPGRMQPMPELGLSPG
jgi:hypothetical protein